MAESHVLALLDYWKTQKMLSSPEITDKEQILYDECLKITQKLTPSISDPDISKETSIIPNDIYKLIEILIKQVPKAIIPLKRRRKGCTSIPFDNEYDFQDYIHSLLIPWFKDIRPEEFTPSHASTQKRVDFLLNEYDLFIEVKYVRDKAHAKKLGDEITIDIHHYQSHQKCKSLIAMVFDLNCYIQNPIGFSHDLSRKYKSNEKEIEVRVYVIN